MHDGHEQGLRYGKALALIQEAPCGRTSCYLHQTPHFQICEPVRQCELGRIFLQHRQSDQRSSSRRGPQCNLVLFLRKRSFQDSPKKWNWLLGKFPLFWNSGIFR